MEVKKMKTDPTKTQMHILYRYTGIAQGSAGEMTICFELNDDFALVLRLPWSDYTVTFPWDPNRPLTVGDTVSVVYERTHNTTARLSWKPVDWYQL